MHGVGLVSSADAEEDSPMGWHSPCLGVVLLQYLKLSTRISFHIFNKHENESDDFSTNPIRTLVLEDSPVNDYCFRHDKSDCRKHCIETSYDRLYATYDQADLFLWFLFVKILHSIRIMIFVVDHSTKYFSNQQTNYVKLDAVSLSKL